MLSNCVGALALLWPWADQVLGILAVLLCSSQKNVKVFLNSFLLKLKVAIEKF